MLCAAVPAVVRAELLPLRIGIVIPSRTGEVPVASSVNDYTGEAARLGIRLAESRLADDAEDRGLRLDLLLANAPSPRAAERAARRLVEVEQIAALVGGIGDGQARVLMAIAEEAGIPFLNVGDTQDALRGPECNRHTFHLEASDAMYLDAMASLAVTEGRSRWFVVHEDGPAGAALLARAGDALEKFSEDGEIVGAAAVPAGKSAYTEEIDAADRLGADQIVLLLDPFDQMVFIGQQEFAAAQVPILAFPHTLTQTRDYIAAARYFAPRANPPLRVALWESTIDEGAAGAFNDTYRSRFGEPTDPTAWSTFSAVRILIEAAAATGSTAPAALIDHLSGSGAEFDLLKGPATSFRPWDHQLRQPLYVVRVDQEVEWQRMSLPSRIAIAELAGQLPGPEPGEDATAALDRFGDTAERTSCRF